MGSTRAKFKCVEVGKRVGWGSFPLLYSAKFNAVVNGSTENETFFAATPSGSLQIDTVRADHFEVGKEYYLDFTVAP